MDNPEFQGMSRGGRDGKNPERPPEEYVPGICNIDRKGRLIRGAGALVGLVFVVIYNESWRTFFTHPALYAFGLVLLSTGTALSLIQAMASFCVVDAFLGRTLIPGSSSRPGGLSPEDRKTDRKRALTILLGSLVAGLLFSAVLLISEINQSRQ